MAINIQYRNPFGGAAAFFAGRGRARSQAKAQEAQMQFQADQVFGQQIATGITNFVQPVAQAAIFKGLGGMEGLTSDEQKAMARNVILGTGGGGGRRPRNFLGGDFPRGPGSGPPITFGGRPQQFSNDQMFQMGEQFLEQNPDFMPGFGKLTGTDRDDAIIRAGRAAVQQQGAQQQMDLERQRAQGLGQVKEDMAAQRMRTKFAVSRNFERDYSPKQLQDLAALQSDLQGVMRDDGLNEQEKIEAANRITREMHSITPSYQYKKKQPTLGEVIEGGQRTHIDRENGLVWTMDDKGNLKAQKHDFENQDEMSGETWGRQSIYTDAKTGLVFYKSSSGWKHVAPKTAADNMKVIGGIMNDVAERLQRASDLNAPEGELSGPAPTQEEITKQTHAIMQGSRMVQRQMEEAAELYANEKAREKAQSIARIQEQRQKHQQAQQQQQLIDLASNPQVVQKAQQTMAQILDAVGGDPSVMPDNLQQEWQQAQQIVQVAEQLQGRRAEHDRFLTEGKDSRVQQQGGGNGNQMSDQQKAQMALTEIKRRYPDPRKAPDEIKQQIPKLTQLAQGGGQGATAPATTQPAG